MKYDVVVAGGGVAGICAAISAARCGKEVLLIDKQILLGGMATLGRIHWLEPYCDGQGRRVIHGLAGELFDHAVACGYRNIPENWQAGEGRLTSWFSPENFMLFLPQWLKQENVSVLLDAMVTAVTLKGDRMVSVTVSHMAGNTEITADAFVDATGMAQLFLLAGLPCENGRNFLTMVGDTVRMAELRRALEEERPYRVRGRKNYGATLYGKGQPKDRPEASIADEQEETEWILAAQELMAQSLSREPAEEREVISLPVIPQIRMVRRMVGEETFTGIPFETAREPIGVIPEFRLPKVLYELPFGSLKTAACRNLFAAGRCISASGDGWHASRVIGPCCLTGEAAGLAAVYQGQYEAVKAEMIRRGNIVCYADLEGKQYK